MDFEKVIKGGTVTTADASYAADIAISAGRIAAIGLGLEGGETIDASGLLVMPGAIDVHTHFATQVGGHWTADDYSSGSRAAAVGGITSFINFAFQEPGKPLLQAIEREYRSADLYRCFHGCSAPSVLDFQRHLPRSLNRCPQACQPGRGFFPTELRQVSI